MNQVRSMFASGRFADARAEGGNGAHAVEQPATIHGIGLGPLGRDLVKCVVGITIDTVFMPEGSVGEIDLALSSSKCLYDIAIDTLVESSAEQDKLKKFDVLFDSWAMYTPLVYVSDSYDTNRMLKLAESIATVHAVYSVGKSMAKQVEVEVFSAKLNQKIMKAATNALLAKHERSLGTIKRPRIGLKDGSNSFEHRMSRLNAKGAFTGDDPATSRGKITVPGPGGGSRDQGIV